MNRINEIYKKLELYIEKLKNPKIAKKFNGFNTSIQIYLSDIDKYISLQFKDQNCRIFKKPNKKADVKLTTTSDVIIDILNRNLDYMEAFISGKIQSKGNIFQIDVLKYLLE